jgi:hypothetical protein
MEINMKIQLIPHKQKNFFMVTNVKIKINKLTNKMHIECVSTDDPTHDGLYTLQQSDGLVLFEGTLVFQTNPNSIGIRTLVFVGNCEEACKEILENEINITSYVFDKSLNFVEQQVPKNINITLQAEWMQKNGGIFDFGRRIASQFPQGMISSLNESFGECDFKIKKSGYTLLSSSFDKITPPSTGGLDIYPTHTPNILVDNKNVLLPRYWFHGTWKMSWEYEQKRVEKLSFQLPLCPFGANEDQLTLRVQNIEELANFCESDASIAKLWPQIVQNALISIKENLFAKYQSIVKFVVPFDFGVTLKLFQSVRIVYADYSIHGKIIEIEGIAQNTHKIANISVAMIPPWLQLWITSQHIVRDITETCQLEGLVEQELTENECIIDVIIENDAESQITKLVRKKYSTEAEVRTFLSEDSTCIFVRLKDLKTKKHLIHTLTAKIIVNEVQL